ncbi:MAG: response regulator [Reichenbachiella sp.]|uniref:LytR/AlgR family response regulator transcription factor n=1 Tax=Reichenbachiella sp. TaxID=2184521 RepID=UPI003264A161
MKYSCVCIDDDKMFNEILEQYIKHVDFLEFLGAYSNPIEGVMAIDKLKPDILFLDVDMPEINGFTTIDALEHKPIIVMVSSHWEHEKELLEAGAAKFVMKPIVSPEHLAQIVNEVVKREGVK